MIPFYIATQKKVLGLILKTGDWFQTQSNVCPRICNATITPSYRSSTRSFKELSKRHRRCNRAPVLPSTASCRRWLDYSGNMRWGDLQILSRLLVAVLTPCGNYPMRVSISPSLPTPVGWSMSNSTSLRRDLFSHPKHILCSAAADARP